MSAGAPLGWFEGYGVELEYMAVRRDSLDVLPVVDQVFHTAEGAWVSDVERGSVAWSNELVLHVLELKANGPVKTLSALERPFQDNVAALNHLLAPLDGCLMPGGAHPWMDPAAETRLWPHENAEIYATFDRIFDCRRHGWANVQACHLNLPFSGDEQFGRLHAAIRLLLPILPALAAASPVLDGRRTGFLDARLEAYRANSLRIPSITGCVIPEPVFTRDEYVETILKPIYRDIAPLDPEGMLQHEFLNARGAIARFERDTIEIRVLDMQECPAADLAILELVVRVLRELTRERWCDYRRQRAFDCDELAALMGPCVRDGEMAVIGLADYLEAFGFPSRRTCRAGELWAHLLSAVEDDGGWVNPIRTILDRGTLATRILRALNEPPSPQQLHAVYQILCGCLRDGDMLVHPTSSCLER